MSDEELIARIENVRFTPVRRRAGYDMGDVDSVLDHLQAAVRVGEALQPLVAIAKLRTTKLREGYDIDEVDAFLGSLAGPADVAAAPAPVPTAVQAQRGFFARLFGR